ncbi:MAG: ABC transporter substrate-binding protein [Gaiella sp.]|nr:ABC transporter substrate-binding protein [Gaiella sp.]
MTDAQVTRREVLRAGAAGALLLGSGGLLGSLGGDAARAASLASLAGDAKRGGTLRVGIAGGSPTDDFDMAHINGPSATVRGQVFYETLTYLDGQFRLHNDFLVDECRPNATADQWTVRLKQGVEFHNGKTVTADDVLYSIKRLMNPKSGATAAGQLTAIDLKKTKKLDNRTVRFVLKRPQSFFDYLLSDIVYIVPIGYDPKKPVSTGPWRFKSFQPARQTVLTRFENYHGTAAYADQLILSELPDDTARVNALLSGQVDAINQVPYAQVSQLKGQSALKVAVSPTGGWNPITMRVDVAPFNDVRVRQAIRLAMNRKQAIAAALYGQGAPAADTYGRFDPAFSASFKREQDIEQAKSLLKQAGQSNLKLELVTSPIAAGIVEACQVLAQNAKAAGINITVRKIDPGTYFSRYGKWPFAIDFWVGLPYLVVASIADGPGASVVNTTHFNDPGFNKLFNQAAKTLDAKKRAQIVHEMQRIQYQRGGYIIWSFQNGVDAYSKKVGGIQPIDKTAWGLGRCQLHKLYLQ